jgi:hypothetical protein
MHQIGCMSVKGKALGDKSKAKLAQLWKDVDYLILDEFSMLSKRFFGQLSRHIAIAKMAYNPLVADLPFGIIRTH